MNQSEHPPIKSSEPLEGEILYATPWRVPAAYPPDLVTRADVQHFLQALPATLDGTTGIYRAEPSSLAVQAVTDYEAATKFCASRRAGATQTAYTKEFLRLQLWAASVAQVPLSSLVEEHWDAYVAFLLDPDPSWCAPRTHTKHSDPRIWRPFVAGLTDQSARTTLNILNSGMAWMVKHRYLSVNTLGLIDSIDACVQSVRRRVEEAGYPRSGGGSIEAKPRGVSVPGKDSPVPPKDRRVLQALQVAAVFEAARRLPVDTVVQQRRRARALFLLALMYTTAPRVNDMVRAVMADLLVGDGGYIWYARTKGKKAIQRPLTSQCVAALAQYRQAFALPPLPSPADGLPLILDVRSPSKGIGARNINRILKTLGQQGAEILRARERETGDVLFGSLAAALPLQSSHWWRHTSATVQMYSGEMNLYEVQRMLGHASPQTTAKSYLHDRPAVTRKKLERVLQLPTTQDTELGLSEEIRRLAKDKS